jgi:iron complex outermembrane recepter protein
MKQYILAVFIFAFYTINAQNFDKIKGRVLSNENEALSGATILMIGATSDETLKATFTDKEGKYEFDNLKIKSFRISVQFVGFQKNVSNVIILSENNLVIPDILLERVTDELKEVTITAQKAFVTQKADRIIVNPDALVSSAGLTVFEVLERSPSIKIDFNDNISIRGKSGVMVLIDDKPTYLSNEELANYLKSIPASSIDRLEIMNNPPAMYDAAGNAGIISIKMKKNITKGLDGGVNLSFGKGEFTRTNNSFNFNYRIQKWNIFTAISTGRNDTYQDLTIKRTYFTPTNQLSSVFEQNSYITPSRKNNSLKLGVDYYVTPKTTIGIVWNGFNNPSEKNTINNATILDQNQNIINTIQSDNTTQVNFTNGSFNVNMSHKLNDVGKEISINLDHINYNSDINQNLANNSYLPNGNLIESSLLNSSLPSDINIKSAKIDLNGSSYKGIKIDTGAKSSWVKTKNVANFFDVISGNKIPNYEFSNDFTYKENINSLYVNFSKDYKKISIQAGLRLENTNVDGNQAGNPVVKDSTFSIKYTNLFPTLYIQYRADTIQKHVIGLSLGRRIERPDYKDLNPFTYPIDRFTFYGGNPYIQPTFTYNIDVSHTYKNNFTTTLQYSYTKNVIFETNEQRGNIYYSRPGNFAKQIFYGISINGSFKINNWWNLQLYSEFMNNVFQSQVYTETLDDSKWYFAIVPTNQFTISKKWSAELSGQYQTKVLTGQFMVEPIGTVRAGLSKKILKDKGSLKLNISDVFYTNQVQGQIRNIANASASWLSYTDSRVVTLSFSYRFSKGENLELRDFGASETEKNRVKP